MSGRSCHPFLHVNRCGTLVAKALVQAAVVVEVENTAKVLLHRFQGDLRLELRRVLAAAAFLRFVHLS